MKNQITINGQHGVFGAYIAQPETLPASGVIVLHEVFGVNAVRNRMNRTRRGEAIVKGA